MPISSSALIDLSLIDAAIFDLDGVVTNTARVHVAAWKSLFDQYLQKCANQQGQPFQAFDIVEDYRKYVDGKLRYDGVQSFLESRGITLLHGEPSDPPNQETVCGLGNRKNAMFLEALHAHGVDVFPSTLALIQELKDQKKKTAIVSASENCQEILDAAGVADLFDAKVDGRDATAAHLPGKPQLDTYVKAAELLGILPGRAMVVEDAIAGVGAGHAGHFGMVIGIDRAGERMALRKHGSDLVVSDLVELGLRDEEGMVRRSTQSLPRALDVSSELFQHLHGIHLVVFLDYDGTLTPIVDRPELAVLSNDMREVLRELSVRCPVAIISGRDRLAVKQFVNLDALVYAGSHGFDIAGPKGLEIHHEVGIQFRPTLDQAETELREKLAGVSGAIIERKKFSVAVHYRLVIPEEIPQIVKVVDSTLANHPDLRKTEGKKVFDLRPQIEWDKGKAILWLIEALHLDEQDVLPLYIGDDLTDEDAFRALADSGVGIIVEQGFRFTSAHYRLNDPSEVKDFMHQLLQSLETLPT